MSGIKSKIMHARKTKMTENKEKEKTEKGSEEESDVFFLPSPGF